VPKKGGSPDRVCPYCNEHYVPLKGKWRKECCEAPGCNEKHDVWRRDRDHQTSSEYRARQRVNFKSIRNEMLSSGRLCCLCGRRPVARWLTLTCERCFHINSNVADEAVGLAWEGRQ
jgi:hypothetical protein